MHVSFATTAIILLSLVAGQQARGTVNRITEVKGPFEGNYRFTIAGTNPCGAVHLDFGDGTSHTYPIRGLPDSDTVWHQYTRTGNFVIKATGANNCEGEASTRVAVFLPPDPPRPTPTPAPQPPPPPPPAIRFAEMDLNHDRMISRAEWRGSAQSFAVHDWNRDGQLAGDEVRVGAAKPTGGARPRQYEPQDQPAAWTDVEFRFLDRNRDNRVGETEWQYNFEDFQRLDRNGDNVLVLSEFLAGEPAGSGRGQGRGQTGGQGGDQGGGQRGGGVGRGNTSTFVVSAREGWTDTGIEVGAGDVLTIRASGTIQFSANSRDVAPPDGAEGRAATAKAPLPRTVIGALLGRVGNSSPFVVGSTLEAMRVPRSGRLYLGVNDDVVRDNRGEFHAIVTVARGTAR